MKNKKFSIRDVVWIIIGVVVGILISLCIFSMTLMSYLNAEDNNDASNEQVTETQESKGITTYDSKNTVITDKDEIKKIESSILDYVDNIKTGSTYSQVMTGEDTYTYYMYNNNGEVFTQDSDQKSTEVFLNNGKVYRYDTDEKTLSVGDDIDLVTLLENGAKALENDKVTLYDIDITDSELPAGHEYRIDLVGDDTVKLLYESVGKDFADNMLDSIKESLNNNWDSHIIMSYFLGDDIKDSCAYCLYVIDNEEYTNWIFQGYDTTEDWKLDSEWYSYDGSSDDGETYSKMMDNLIVKVNTIMTKYAADKGWTESTESTESTEQQ